jgi:hypothetical protein
MKSYIDFINERAREINDVLDGRSDAGQDIVMKHTNIQGPEMADERDKYAKETDEQRSQRTGLSSLAQGDAEAARVQKTPNRVTLEQLESKVRMEEYLYPGAMPHLTICVLILENGWALVGKSAPADAGNFDPPLGMKFAKEDAMRQLWQLEGYLLRETLYAGSVD